MATRRALIRRVGYRDRLLECTIVNRTPEQDLARCLAGRAGVTHKIARTLLEHHLRQSAAPFLCHKLNVAQTCTAA